MDSLSAANLGRQTFQVVDTDSRHCHSPRSQGAGTGSRLDRTPQGRRSRERTRQAVRVTPVDNFSAPQKMSDASAPIAAAAPLRQASSPLVYVVVLNWNSPQMTADCVRSLLAMSGTGFRVMVVDNGSSNDSAEFLRKSFSDISVIANGRNL